MKAATMGKVMLIDGSNMLWASHYGAGILKSGSRNVGAIYGAALHINKLLRRFPDYSPVVLWDGKKNWRSDFYPEYKQNRGKQNKDREIVKEQRPEVARMLNMLGIDQLVADTHEADDLAGYLVTKNERMSAPAKEYLLITSDADWAQLVGDYCEWYNPRAENPLRVGVLEFETQFPVSALSFLDYKALRGDPSDNIPGVGGIGEGRAANLVNTYGSVEGFMRAFNAGEVQKLPKYLERLAKNLPPPDKAMPNGEVISYPPVYDAFKRNLKLMDLENVPKPDKEVTRTVAGAFDAEAFEDFCYDNNLQKLAANFDTFITPFKVRAIKNGRVKKTKTVQDEAVRKASA
jgi:5'-3' exonuclease